MVSNIPLPENISNDAFRKLLDRYPTLIESISNRKSSKPGQKTLVELDEFRYHDATKLFSSKSPEQQMSHDDVKILVDWKLRHGKFRPTLMKLVSSNDAEAVKETVENAMRAYWKSPDANAALGTISKLKGIGPATASLLLSVHDPERVIFFSDEAFWWLSCSGKQTPIKYNAKEYQKLNDCAHALVKRLGVSATDVEKVAYVVMKDEPLPAAEGDTTLTPSAAKPAIGDVKKAGTKRKEKPEYEDVPDSSLRRSKRRQAGR
ncbi:hypothetical protein TruAng_011474 [Truncatella angustata]|nr:hypothetical protein TruAng_011474 [Truncatella angustata]